jgi:REP element-mobilizing transposase RayT
MPNHFHFVVKIKSEDDIEKLIVNHKKDVRYNKTLQGFETLAGLERHKVISSFLTKNWSNLFNSYTQAYNKQHNRQGSLFMRNYKRKKIQNERYLKKLIHYIHYNPLSAGLVYQLKDWRFSSYLAFLSQKSTNIKRDEVIELFGDTENFKFCHKNPPELTGIDKYF